MRARAPAPDSLVCSQFLVESVSKMMPRLTNSQVTLSRKVKQAIIIVFPSWHCQRERSLVLSVRISLFSSRPSRPSHRRLLCLLTSSPQITAMDQLRLFSAEPRINRTKTRDPPIPETNTKEMLADSPVDGNGSMQGIRPRETDPLPQTTLPSFQVWKKRKEKKRVFA